jgi:hypothetical protein
MLAMLHYLIVFVNFRMYKYMAVAKLGVRGTSALATLFAHGCGAALPHHNHEQDLFGEASPPQTPSEKRLCNRHVYKDRGMQILPEGEAF